MNFSILGTGSSLPPHRISNQDFAEFLDTSDEWITTRTGIRQRHILQGDQTITEFAQQAALKAMEMAGTTPDQLDYVLCATIGGDFVSPSLACTVQQAIGANCPAMDVNGACAGMLYAMQVARGLFALGGVRRILLVAAEGLSHIADYTDRATCVLFGDGAAAFVLGEGDDLLSLHLTSSPRQDVLYIPRDRGNCPGKNKGEPPYLKMNGQEVYKFAVNAIQNGVTTALQQAGLEQQQIDHVFLHQANLRIIEAAQRKLRIPHDKYAINIMDTGNVSAVTIPLLIDTWHRENKLKQGDIMVMSGFGAGLVTGTGVLRWSLA